MVLFSWSILFLSLDIVICALFFFFFLKAFIRVFRYNMGIVRFAMRSHLLFTVFSSLFFHILFLCKLKHLYSVNSSLTVSFSSLLLVQTMLLTSRVSSTCSTVSCALTMPNKQGKIQGINLLIRHVIYHFFFDKWIKYSFGFSMLAIFSVIMPCVFLCIPQSHGYAWC
jgi:hypothetical protein